MPIILLSSRRLGGIGDMNKTLEKDPNELGPEITELFYEHRCGAVDERESRIMVHQILAEIRRSNAPDWVAEELENKLECYECSRSLKRYFPFGHDPKVH